MAPLSQITNKISLVKQIPIFSKLNWFEMHAVAGKASLAEYKKGDVVCREGTPPDALYCVISGRLQAFKMKANGQHENLELILRGMHFGIISLLTGESHSLSFEAMNDSLILKINKDDFYTILKTIPRLGLEFSQSLSRRVRSQMMRDKTIFESTILSIYSPVQGSGSSTFAVNLALSLQRETKRKVVFINISSKEEGVVAGEIGEGDSSPRWRESAVPLREISGHHEKIIARVYSGGMAIDLLTVSINVKDSSVVQQISQFVSTLANDYHYVVVDLPNDMDDVVMETLIQSDLVYLITGDSNEDLALSSNIIARLKENFKGSFDPEKLHVLLSGRNPKCYLSFEAINRSLLYSVTAMLPYINRGELKTPMTCAQMSVAVPREESEYARTLRYIARKTGGVLVGLVLGGGAALGVAHVGVIRILEKEKIPIDVVVGSSMGALIGSLWAAGRNADELETVAREFENKRAMVKLCDWYSPKSGLSGRSIERWLRQHLGSATFAGTKFPFKVVAYDLYHRQEIVISEGSLVKAVRKSIGIPGVISPIMEKGKMIIDGGVLNPLPTNILNSMGIKKIIAINVLQSPSDVVRGYEMTQRRLSEEEKMTFGQAPWQFIGIRVRRFFVKALSPNIPDIIVRTLQATEYLIAQQSAALADVVLHPDLAGVNWFELYQVDKLLQAGEEVATKHLPEIKKLTLE